MNIAIREDRSKWWNRLVVDPRFFDSMDMPIIDQFDGTENVFLSNFFPFPITYKDIKFDTTEHAYQWMKWDGSCTPEGDSWGERIRLAETPAKAKKWGQRCPLIKDWEQIKLQIMKEVLIAKFRDTPLWAQLDATGNAYLIEGNTWHDNCFGICVKQNCERGCWEKMGYNNLGLFLMELRAILRGELKLSLATGKELESTSFPQKRWVRSY